MDRQRREEELKTRSSKKAADAEQSTLNRVYRSFAEVLAVCDHSFVIIVFYLFSGYFLSFFGLLGVQKIN